jgi:hypothetical protein
MENENIKEKEIQIEEPQLEEKKVDSQSKITTPVAIIIAGLLIMGGILITNGGGKVVAKEKTLSEQVGVSKEKLAECIQNFDKDTFSKTIQTSVEGAMKGEDGMGTPFTVVIGANGVKSKINGAYPYEEAKKIIDEVIAGKVTTPYTGEVPPVDANDHVLGNVETAQVTIIEYSDFECTFCAKYHPTLQKIVGESNGNIAWVYRHFPLTQIHPHAMERAIASECVAKIKGNDAFWKYGELLFKLIAPVEAPVAQQL